MSSKYNIICTINNKLKSYKADGSDNIPPKLVKHGTAAVKQKLYKFILKTSGGGGDTPNTAC
jgi:hypothetical protein